MSLLEARLRRLEQENAAGRLIVVSRDEGGDTAKILAEHGIIATDDDLVVSVVRFFEQGRPWPAGCKRVQVQEMAP